MSRVLYVPPPATVEGLPAEIITGTELTSALVALKNADNAWTGANDFADLLLNGIKVVTEGELANNVMWPGFAGGAVGDGTADDTAAVQAALNGGGAVYVPDGRTFKCTTGLTMSVAGTTLFGRGKLNFTAGISQAAAVLVTAERCVVQGTYLANPNQLQAATGNRNYGISVQASEFRATGNLIELFQNGVAVRASGEFQNIRIDSNRIKDVIGAGEGASATTSSLGEDRGDGIIVWGAQATITGNIVNALAGTDARVGIHCESLPGSIVTPAAHSDALCTATGNVVYGPFRRSLVFEGMTGAVATGNTLADATWWNLAIITGSKGCIATDNTLLYTRGSGDLHGEQLEPYRTPIMLYGNVSDSKISGNTVLVSGAAGAYIAAEGTASDNRPTDCDIYDNTCALSGSGTVSRGFNNIAQSSRIRLRRNKFSGFTNRGTYLFGAADFTVTDNEFAGASATSGIVSDSTSAGGICARNKITGVTGTAISLVNHTSPLVVDDNVIIGGNKGIDLFGCSGTGSMRGNLFSGVSTNTDNIPSTYQLDAMSPDVQEFTSSGTWTKPAGAKVVQVRCIGGGGGGGSGRRGAAGTVRTAGAAGAGGAVTDRVLAAALLGSTVSVTVGTGGIGGAAVTANDTNGNDGSSGNGSTFGTSLVRAGGGGFGNGGSTSAATGGTAGAGMSAGGTGGGSSGTGGTGSAATAANAGAGGGGGGGGVSAADAANNGAAGATAPQSVSLSGAGTAGTGGAAGGNGTDQTAGSGTPGPGGGGGGASITVAAGTGGNGGRYGGGAGGGGASLNGNDSGAGGNGANGIVIVTTFF